MSLILKYIIKIFNEVINLNIYLFIISYILNKNATAHSILKWSPIQVLTVANVSKLLFYKIFIQKIIYSYQILICGLY